MDQLAARSAFEAPQAPVALVQSVGLVPYPEAVTAMEARVAAIRAGTAPECLWLLEHPPLYTAGSSAQAGDLLDAHGLPVYQTGRGGQYTYHGPGQRVGYVMLDLKKARVCGGPDVRCFVHTLEEWLIRTLSALGVTGERREGRIGIWVDRPTGEKKIAAIGVRVRHWVTYHGVALNVAPDLSQYAGIVPCGIREHGVTSLRDLGVDVTMADVDAVLCDVFRDVFGASLHAEADSTISRGS
jgi:lipoyl(octanoyl) transferase